MGFIGMVVGSALAALVLVAEPLTGLVWSSFEPNQVETAFLRRPETQLWILVAAVQGGLWLVLGGAARGVCREALKLAEQFPRRSVLLASGALLVGALLPLALVSVAVIDIEYRLANLQVKVIVATLVALVVAAPAVTAIWLVGWKTHEALRKTPTDDADWAADATLFLGLRDCLDRALLILGVMVSGAILASAALHNALRVSGVTGTSSYVLLYGAFLTAVLGALYVPAYLRIQSLGSRVAGGPQHATGLLEAHELRQKRIGGAAGPVESLKAGVLVLGPLITSLLGVFLSGK